VAHTLPDPPLTPDQLAQAIALWREAERQRVMGVNMSLLSHNGHQWRLRPVGRPVDLPKSHVIVTTT
jgi:hypothetical protein